LDGLLFSVMQLWHTNGVGRGSMAIRMKLQVLFAAAFYMGD